MIRKDRRITPPSPPQKWTAFATPRINEPELLDMGIGTHEDVQTNLREMARINRYLGGFRSITRYLCPRLRMQSAPASIADIGTGSADLLILLSRWARRQSLSLNLIGVDFAARHLAIARRMNRISPDIQFIQADATRLPLAPDSVDYLVSSLFLHHLEAEQVIALLRDSFQAARRGIVMSDLVRGWLPLIGFKLVQPVFARHEVTRLDGEASIRRAFMPDELYEMACAAGLPQARVYTSFPWRMTLVVDK
jgi:hypothetical protein